MVRHALKGDPALRDLEHVQVDGPGLVYLFFYDQHGYHGLSKEEALTMHFTHSGCLCRVDWEVCTLRRGPSTAQKQDGNACDSH